MKDRRYAALFLVVFGILGAVAIQGSPLLDALMLGIAVAGIALFAIPFVWGRTLEGRGLGYSEGDRRGPPDGQGAVVHESPGTRDFDGTDGEEIPPRGDARSGGSAHK